MCTDLGELWAARKPSSVCYLPQRKQVRPICDCNSEASVEQRNGLHIQWVLMKDHGTSLRGGGNHDLVDEPHTRTVAPGASLSIEPFLERISNWML